MNQSIHGGLSILWLNRTLQGDVPKLRVTFARYSGGRALPHREFVGLEGVTRFLSRDCGLDEATIAPSLQGVRESGNGYIGDLDWSDARLSGLGLL